MPISKKRLLALASVHVSCRGAFLASVVTRKGAASFTLGTRRAAADLCVTLQRTLAALQQVPHLPVRIRIGRDLDHRVEGRHPASDRAVVLPYRRPAVVVLEQDVGLSVP